MSYPAAPALEASQSLGDAPALSEVAGARAALELLLELGMQIVDGDASALHAIAPTLTIVMERLDEIDRSLCERAPSTATPFLALLAEHAARRRESDLRELDALRASLNEAEAPSAIGRSVVVTALVLLSNFDSDQRWCERLVLPGSAAEAA